MQSFHDDKLWQEAYVAVIEVWELFGSSEDEILAKVRQQALEVLSFLADASTRRDRREADTKIREAAGRIASIRSLLSVAWGQQVLTDADFKKIDDKYDLLSKSLR